ncbi:MAG: dihydrofolate reductase [Candidatus Nomurabacteria bacterium]|nr:dihydrofolate reductase [Candidatus Nomurabacteria bacterium]
MKKFIIVAYDKNQLIGLNGKIPWNLSGDLKNFKKLTAGQAVAMGRRTFESIGRALPGRQNIVITSGKIVAKNIEAAPDLTSALKLVQPGRDLFWIGGAGIYREALAKNLVDAIYATEVDAAIVAAGGQNAAYFPKLSADWRAVKCGGYQLADAYDDFSYAFLKLERAQ